MITCLKELEKHLNLLYIYIYFIYASVCFTAVSYISVINLFNYLTFLEGALISLYFNENCKKTRTGHVINVIQAYSG